MIQHKTILTRGTRTGRSLFAASLLLLGPVTGAAAQDGPPAGIARAPTLSYNLFGAPGLIDMPSAEMAAEGDLSATVSHFGGTTRTTLSFQILPRLAGSFRYSHIDPYNTDGDELYDRSFDLRYLLLEEGQWSPALAIGLQDFIGTSVYSSEYIVATKHITPTLSVTGGIGWGRLASYGTFDNPLGAISDHFDTREGGFVGRGGRPKPSRWFTGDAAAFGGLAWQVTDKLVFKAEYSSDDFDRERRSGANDWESPFNFGLDYRLAQNISAQGYYLHGTEVGASLTLTFNPRESTAYGGLEPAPPPVAVRAPGASADLGWTTGETVTTDSLAQTRKMMNTLGLDFEAVSLSADTVTLKLRNHRYGASAEAVGRAARVMTRTLPASVETFRIIPIENGQPQSMVTLKRRDLEAFEFAARAPQESRARAQIDEAPLGDADQIAPEDLYPRFRWSLGPYIALSYFDPDRPVRADLGLELNAQYDLSPGVRISGALRKKLAGNVGGSDPSNSVLPHVRSDASLYSEEGDPGIEHLTAAHFGRPGEHLYSRITAGLLEPMFAGISGELLWKPVDSRLALGAEVNYVWQREFDQMFGLQDYEVATGHVSAYYDFDRGFLAQVDVGRYLAGDWGATFALDREFRNGFRVGAYVTLTDVSFDDFGEGSFDKGLRFTIPVETLFGTPDRRVQQTTLQSLARDGGARLRVDDRLYETVRKNHETALTESWGRFWR
ncbi:YjbH domain-containing protein [Celeribacter indicus]|uniref:Lipoprotein n=1 Tax=Celeribacter indicus TaxID=1208324 RepID=A0A0B5E6X5_9RHOB|nr:YjbH domain-containing protein [Celeribacter indicus]AJE48776.1 hypothetical protein P73_4061 [Celeribacter indicus]SDX10848.1 Exopolysaccharide biosynthesis protein YbjH [Celeribacter indicus]